PGPGHVADIGLTTQLPFRAHFTGHARHFRGKGAELVHHGVDDVLDLEDLAADIDGNLLRKVTGGDGGGHLGDVAELHRQVACHQLDIVSTDLPGAGHALDLRLAAELAFGAHFTGHAGHFRGERAELVHHRVHGVLELEDFALDVDGDLLGEVAVSHGGGDSGDVAHLAGEVTGHRVDVVGQVFPRSGDAFYPCL